MKKVLRFTSLLSLLILALSACVPASASVGVPTKAPVPTPQETQVQTTAREAQVKSVEIQTTKADPGQVNAIVRGNLTEACATMGDTQMRYANNTFMITLMVNSPNDRGCAQVITPFEQTIPLNTTDLPAGEYTVKANGVSAVFTLPIGEKPTAVATASGEAGQTKTYISKLYGYQVSYPADWTIQVNTSVPAGAGSNPEYVTLTTSDKRNLPQIDLWVLTGEPPMSGFENCEKNFVFRNLPACHLSVPAGQNPAAEVWIFQNGTANFFIRMNYQDTNSMQLFNDFLSSFEFTQ